MNVPPTIDNAAPAMRGHAERALLMVIMAEIFLNKRLELGVVIDDVQRRREETISRIDGC